MKNIRLLARQHRRTGGFDFSLPLFPLDLLSAVVFSVRRRVILALVRAFGLDTRAALRLC